MPLGFSVKEEAKRASDNSLAAINRRAEARRARSRREVEQREASRGWSTRDAQPQEWAETMRRVVELPPQAPTVMSYEDVRALAAAQDAWAAEHNGGVGGAAELSERTSNPNYWGPVADALSAPFEVLGMGDTGARNTLENNLRSVGEGIVGPEELMGAARRDARGEADGWDYATIGLTALPFDGLIRPAGRAISNSRVGQAARGALDYVGDSRVGRWLGENVISPSNDVVESVARPSVAAAAPYRYEADLQNIYDINADPDNLVAVARAHAGRDPVTGEAYQPTIPFWMYQDHGVESTNAASDVERLARQYGYSGYVSDFAPSWAPQSRRAAAVFDPVNVRRLP